MTLPTAAPPADVRLAHCLLDAQGTVLSAHAPDLPFYAASTIKLHVLLAALRAADEGRLDVMAEVPAACTFLRVLAVMTGGLPQDEADPRIQDLVRELCGDLATCATLPRDQHVGAGACDNLTGPED
ncbi:serine hydrolase [Brachybacterium massiliense]|uniref:serine hydrolase n=1 Tax=Brachybacterium massiliense TaxID=1755098 RepID=UPI000B3BC79B|nr:serine hydrolase [Brachybacterium massiliense]